jgi:hypothetical protein
MVPWEQVVLLLILFLMVEEEVGEAVEVAVQVKMDVELEVEEKAPMSQLLVKKKITAIKTQRRNRQEKQHFVLVMLIQSTLIWQN